MRIKVITSILITFLLLLLSYYPIMYVNTNSIVNYAENVFKGKVDYSKIKNTPIEIYYPDEINFKKVDVSIKRKFVWHNFNSGRMYVNYTCTYYDNSGKMTCSSSDVDAIWNIKKTDGEWVITGVIEDP
mgnify:CR=1 FL=1